MIISSLLHCVADALRIEFVYLDQVLENLAEVSEVLLSDTRSNFLVDLNNKVDALDNIWTHKLVGTLVSTLKDLKPVLVCVLE
jgi:hypothetical protein